MTTQLIDRLMCSTADPVNDASVGQQSVPGPRSVARHIVERWSAAAALVVLATATLFFNLSSYRTFGSHEAYVAVVAREMLTTGDWIVPRFGGLPRLEKPPLAYWIVAAVSSLGGEVTHQTARLPQALSALLLAVLVGFWARQWYGRLAGFCAVVAQLSSVWVIIFGRKAEVDMTLCLLTTSALAVIALAPGDETRRQRFLRTTAFYVLLALSFLAKFHYGTAMVAAPVLVWLLLRGGRNMLWSLLNPIGLTMFAAAVVVWPMMLVERIPAAMETWSHETVGRAIGSLGRDPIWFYVPHLLWLTLPWLPFAAAAMPRSARRAWRRAAVMISRDFGRLSPRRPGSSRSRVRRVLLALRSGDPREQFLWIWLLVDLAILTASANKHKHYLLAALPVVSLLAAQALAKLIQDVRDGRQLFTIRWAAVWACLLAASSMATYRILLPTPARATLWPAVACAVAIAAGVLAPIGLYRRRWRLAAAAAAAFALSTLLVAMQWVVPAHDSRAPIADFAGAVRARLPDGETVHVFGLGYHAAVYYVDAPVQRHDTAESLIEFLEHEGTLSVVTCERRAHELEPYGTMSCRAVSGPLRREPPLIFVTLTKLVAARSARPAGTPSLAR